MEQVEHWSQAPKNSSTLGTLIPCVWLASVGEHSQCWQTGPGVVTLLLVLADWSWCCNPAPSVGRLVLVL